jgi:hypothetical protein
VGSSGGGAAAAAGCCRASDILKVLVLYLQVGAWQ